MTNHPNRSTGRKLHEGDIVVETASLRTGEMMFAPEPSLVWVRWDSGDESVVPRSAVRLLRRAMVA